MKTPVGFLAFSTSAAALTGLRWHNTPGTANTTTTRAEKQLTEYFNGTRQYFDLELKLGGTPFQQKVWQALQTIPYGETRTYSEIAAMVGSHPRAVGGAIGKNPIPIVIPCHRVVGKNGALTGFSGGAGIPTKQQLLALEAKHRAS